MSATSTPSKTLNVLLGAGFSFDAGLPLVKGIDEKFNRDLRNQLIRYSASEWGWLEQRSEAVRYEYPFGSSNAIVLEYVLNGIVERYISDRESFINYEDFFSFIVEKDRDWFYQFYKQGAKQYLFDKEIEGHKNVEEFDGYKYFSQKQVNEIFHAFQFLISQLLIPKVALPDLLTLYDPFIKHISNYDRVNFFTLNHDLVLEILFDEINIDYSNGFSREGSSLVDLDGNPQLVFKDAFNAQYSIFKLHGSIDHCGFAVAELQENGYMHQRTGEMIYCIPDDKHRVKRIDPASGEVVQEMMFDIEPRFLTGTLKKPFIENDPMYSKLYGHFRDAMNTTDDLLIIGYSYCDEHINSVLEAGKSNSVFNVNPGQKYPFKQPAINIDFINDLSNS